MGIVLIVAATTVQNIDYNRHNKQVIFFRGNGVFTTHSTYFNGCKYINNKQGHGCVIQIQFSVNMTFIGKMRALSSWLALVTLTFTH